MRFIPPIAVAISAFALQALTPSAARAQTGTEEAPATGKGIAGGALLGAELVLATEAAFGTKPVWAYIVGGVAGAAAGGVGGYFVEDSAEPRISFILLTAGMALAIPTTIAVFSTTAYEPPEDAIRDQAPDEPIANPAVPSARAPQKQDSEDRPRGSRLASNGRGVRTEAAARAVNQRAGSESNPLAAPALLALQPGVLSLNLPAIALKEVYSLEERTMWGAPASTELRVPVLSYTF